MRETIFGLYEVFIIIVFLRLISCAGIGDGLCDRRPLGTKADPLPPDNRFLIDIANIRDDKYIPKKTYNVRLYSRDGASPFIAFSISLRGDSMKNKVNPRKPIPLKPGTLAPNSDNTKYSSSCNNTIIQIDITPKTEAKVLWTAPDKDNKCVTIFAVVAVQPDVWYSFEGPLSKRVCEDRRKNDDMQPMENDNCTVCEDARYQLTIEGMWSLNTHPLLYPSSPDQQARFSDVVGASHASTYTLFKFSSEASDGLKLLAEQGNTTELELEILDAHERMQVRTLIKASAPPHPNLSTITNFRVTSTHHMVSLAMALIPSPDWFLGVSNFELCDVIHNNWAENVTFNLYPIDAGTDSGKKFESANEETLPKQPIKSAEIVKSINKEEIRPFARLMFHLVRTYNVANCSDESTDTDIEPGKETCTQCLGTDEGEGGSEVGEDAGSEEEQKPSYRSSPTTTTTTTEEPASVDPATEESECPMTVWGEWEMCEGDCVEGKVEGYQTRFRHHVDNPTPECLEKMSTEEFQRCDAECEEEQQEEEEEDAEE